MTETEVTSVIVATVRAELSPCGVRVHVRERENYDDDGERVFVVTVSIEADCALDDRKMLGLIRTIRAKLSEADVRDVFPMLSFIAQHDEQKSGLEFA